MLKEIVENASSNETEQRRIIFKANKYLIDDECLQDDFAVSNINILAEVFGYNLSLQVGNKNSNSEAPTPAIKGSLNSNVVSNAIDAIKCTNCGYKNPKGSKFCNSCGSELDIRTTVKCVNCGREISNGSTFCNFCGSRQVSQNSLLPPSNPSIATSTKPNRTVNKQNISKNNNSFQSLLDAIKSSIGLEMVYCSAGSFIMGSPYNELGRNVEEIQHNVTLTKPFYIGKFPITQSQYKSIIGSNPSKFAGENNPVECVIWNEAKVFCDKLNSKFNAILPNGYKFDLPTEAQWEYACRAGTTTALNNGKDITSETGRCYNLDDVGWYYQNSDGKTHPVGRKKPNAWGIYDMHGNVWEWCRDWYGDYPNYSVTDPVGLSIGSCRVSRGGSWFNDARNCRSADRNFFPDFRDDFIGFRLAIVPSS